MVKHIVMWHVKNEHHGQIKEELVQEMKAKLLALPAKIEAIQSMEVEANMAYHEKNADIVLITTFESFSKLEEYSKHPEHVKVVEFVRQIVEGRACVDFEF